MIKLRKPINRVSKKRRRDLAVYTQQRKWFLAANPFCAWGLAQEPQQHLRSEEVHHVRGRAGRLYLNEKFWMAVSHVGHQAIHERPELARQQGLLCQRGEWGKQT